MERPCGSHGYNRYQCSNYGTVPRVTGGRRCRWTCLQLRCICAAVCLAAAWGLAGGEIVKGFVNISPEEQAKQITEKHIECLKSINAQPPPPTNGSYCPATWDSLLCWPMTLSGVTVFQPCPDYVNAFYIHQNASRTCGEDGQWFIHPVINKTWTDFRRCLAKPTESGISPLIKAHLGRLRLMYNIGYGISLASLVLAVAIMLIFKKLHCPRNTIHLNLFASFILRAAMSFMKENLLVEGLGFQSDVIESENGIQFKQNSSHWECKLFFTSFYYVLGANYMWIFVEALYLHMLISVAVFSERTGIKYYILFGWASPLASVIPWAIVRATKEDVLCWNTHPTEGYFWITRGPIVASIVLNFFLFLNIIRVLFTKLNAVNSPEAKKFRYRKLAKSTLVLIPLFGVHYIVFIGLPSNVDERTELVKLYFEMFFNSIQGFFVALLFCFLNGEVQSEIRKTWQRFRLTHQKDFRSSCRLRSNCNTLTSYMSRTGRESIGSENGQDSRSKADGQVCVEETPLQAVRDHHVSNGKLGHCQEQQPIIVNCLREDHWTDGDGSVDSHKGDLEAL